MMPTGKISLVLELYHHGTSTCAAKVRLALAEKGLGWTGNYVDILKGDQFNPEYLKLNKDGVVPTLVHDGRVIVDSTVIIEYLEDAFPDRPLRPASSYDKTQMRLWLKVVDEQLHPVTGEISYVTVIRHTLLRLPSDKLEAFLASCAPLNADSPWYARRRAVVLDGFGAPDIAKGFRVYDRCLANMEATLAKQPWLAGGSYSLADLAMTSYMNRVDMIGMTPMWERERPHVTDWFNRIRSRPSFKAMVTDWCPEDIGNDMRTHGAASWPQVERLLQAATSTRSPANA